MYFGLLLHHILNVQSTTVPFFMIRNSQLQETLPNYATAVRDRQLQVIRPDPPNPVTYTFTGWAQGSDSILLMPPQEAESQQPLYRITVQLDLNPFFPVSYITRVFRCGVEDGELVGEFGLTWNGTPGLLQIGDTTTRISSVLSKASKCFDWNAKNNFRWDCRSILDDGSPLCVCYVYLPSSSFSASPEPIQVATFVPPPQDALPPLPEATLTVFPIGHKLMDEILISSLIVVRMLNQ